MTLSDFKLNPPEEILDHKLTVAPGFVFSPQDFYARVENAVNSCKLPGLEVARVDHAEGGILSDKRTYLRFIRERLAFEACASPFGTEFFFSCRTIYSPVQVKLWQLFIAQWFLGLLFVALVKPLGVTFSAIAVVTLIIALGQVFQNANAMGLADLDALLLKIPIVSPIYERWFRKDTFYRQDTRLVYLEAIPRLVQGVIDEITSEKGVKLVNQFERAPILGDLYKPRKKPE